MDSEIRIQFEYEGNYYLGKKFLIYVPSITITIACFYAPIHENPCSYTFPHLPKNWN